MDNIMSTRIHAIDVANRKRWSFNRPRLASTLQSFVGMTSRNVDYAAMT
jgi:hypothetical protein